MTETRERPLTHSPEDILTFIDLFEPTWHPGGPWEIVRAMRAATAGTPAGLMLTARWIQWTVQQHEELRAVGLVKDDVVRWWDDGEPGPSLVELARAQAAFVRGYADDLALDSQDPPAILNERIRVLRERAERLDAWADLPRDDYLAEITEEYDAEIAVTVDAVVRRINRTYFTVTKDGGYAVGREQRNPSLGHREIAFFAEAAVRKDLDRRKVEVPDGKGGTKAAGVGTVWASHPGRRHYRHVTFDPNPLFHEGEGGDRTVNLFRGFAVEPDPAADWSPLETLIRDVICGGHEDRYDFVTRWAAQMVQRPHEAAGVVLALPGPKGAGKGTLGRALMGLVAPHSIQLAQPDQLTNKFNSHFARTICLFVDEAFFSGDKKGENVLKALITEPTFVCEPKGVDAFPVRNMLHIVMATNNEWAAPTDVTDRRYAVLSPEQEAVERFKKEIGFGRILRGQGQVRPEILSGWMRTLLRTDVDGWRADQHIPDTDALRRQRLLTSRRDVMTGWWERVLQVGGTQGERVPGWPDGPGEVGPAMKDQLEVSLRDYVQSLPYRERHRDKAAIGQWLRETFGYRIDVNVGSGADRRRGWLLPSLERARSDFENRVGSGAVDWEPFEQPYWADTT